MLSGTESSTIATGVPFNGEDYTAFLPAPGPLYPRVFMHLSSAKNRSLELGPT